MIATCLVLGWSDTDLADTVKFAHADNLRSCAILGRISYTSRVTIAESTFVTVATGVGLRW